MMEVDQKYYKHLEFEEGLRLKAYNDVGGKLTIGIGHLLTKREKDTGFIQLSGELIKWKDGITREQAWKIAKEDSKTASDCVNKYVTVPLTQNQFNALVSLTFNIGTGAFRASTLLRLLNQSKYGSVPTQMRRWVLVGGKEDAILKKRREREIALWLS